MEGISVLLVIQTRPIRGSLLLRATLAQLCGPATVLWDYLLLRSHRTSKSSVPWPTPDPETMSSSRIPCTYERQVYIIMSPLYWAKVVIICLLLLWPVHAIQLCCIIVGPSYTMTAQHKSKIGCASFTCVVVNLLLCKTKIPAECPKWC